MFKKAILAAAAITVVGLAVPAAAETFTSSDGVISIELPNENWKEVEDPAKWIALSDGGNEITIEHLSNGEELPKMAIADDNFVNVYQGIFSTQNEVFIVTGSVLDAEMMQPVKEAIMSTQVLKFDTKMAVKKDTPEASEFTVVPMSATYYVTSDGINVRMGCSTSTTVLGGIPYGDPVNVTGKVQRGGQDIGWFQVNFQGSTGYVNASFVSETKPAAKTEEKKSDESTDGVQRTGRVKTVYHADGWADTIYECTNGNWVDANGVWFVQVTEYDFISALGEGEHYTTNKPQTGDVKPAGSPFDAYFMNGNATQLTLYTDGYYYSTSWVRYTDNGDGSYKGSDGTVVYNYDPHPENASSDSDANTDGGYDLISRGSGRPVHISAGGGAFYDSEGNEFYNQGNGVFVDEYGAEYDVA